MKTPKTQKQKQKTKREKPLKLDMGFDEAVKRIVRVKPSAKK